MTDPRSPPKPDSNVDNRHGTWPYTRLVATLILIPSVPMLLLSVIALALFYVAPTRFGNLIDRLPGEAFIRSALVFAPATLFAVVVLAVLYALDRPKVDVSITKPRPRLDKTTAVDVEQPTLAYTSLVARFALAPAVLALLVSTTVWALSFVSPSRFDHLIAPLPGDRYLRPIVPLTPIFFFAVVLLATYLSFYRSSRHLGVTRTSRPINLAVSLILVAAAPILLVSLAALGLFYLSPARFESVIARIPYEAFVRLALTFAPAILFAVVLLAYLYLGKRGVDDATQPTVAKHVQRKTINLQHWRSQFAQWVLVGGLILTAVVVLGLLGVVIYLVLLR